MLTIGRPVSSAADPYGDALGSPRRWPAADRGFGVFVGHWNRFTWPGLADLVRAARLAGADYAAVALDWRSDLAGLWTDDATSPSLADVAVPWLKLSSRQLASEPPSPFAGQIARLCRDQVGPLIVEPSDPWREATVLGLRSLLSDRASPTGLVLGRPRTAMPALAPALADLADYWIVRASSIGELGLAMAFGAAHGQPVIPLVDLPSSLGSRSDQKNQPDDTVRRTLEAAMAWAAFVNAPLAVANFESYLHVAGAEPIFVPPTQVGPEETTDPAAGDVEPPTSVKTTMQRRASTYAP